MNAVRFLTLAVLLFVGLGNRTHAAERTYYSMVMNGNPIGYAVTEVSTVREEGRELLRVTSDTSFKFALLGKPQQIQLKAVTLLQPNTRQPVEYRLTSTTNAVVHHIECEFSENLVRTWSYAEGDERGTPTETKLPMGTRLLGANNFGHWRMLAEAALPDSGATVARIPVFIPEARQVETFELVRGEPAEVEVLGTARRCMPWRADREDLAVFVDAATREFVRLDLPGQKTTITLADESAVKRAQKAQVEELLARHFVSSSVHFDDYLKVSALTADVDVQVIGSGVANETSVLTTAMQQFQGSKDKARISGTVTIQVRPYEGQNAPPFPGQPERELADWLRPEPFIESDHADVVTRSAELTRGAANRWDATLRIARWVEHEIRYVLAETPSARLALEKREGDCGPHATLTVAMLRAAGIPARLVGGVIYTPSFGGSFGQHAWVEVHMGLAGWIALDPTTGEFEHMNATHIKLFEGMGGVLPTTVRVTRFEPPNREPTPADPLQAKPIPWEPGKTYTYRYTQGGQELGTERFTLKPVERDGKAAFEMQSELELKAAGITTKGPVTLLITPAARPLSFRRELDTAGQKYTIECTFGAGQVREKISGAKDLTQEIKVPAGVYCFDNNLLSSLAMICSQLPLEVGKDVEVRTFHPSSLQVIPLTFKPQGLARIRLGDHELECFECEVLPIKNTFWIARDGRFVKAQQANLVIELIDTRE